MREQHHIDEATATNKRALYYYASVDTTPRVQKTLGLIYPNLMSQLGDRHYMLLRRSADGGDKTVGWSPVI
jgi:hypothetical protein